MFRTRFARVFRKTLAPTLECRPFRRHPALRLESLEAREVPAMMTWVGSLTDGDPNTDTDFNNLANWTQDGMTATRLPTAGDDVYFNSSMYGDCDGFEGAGGAYNSVVVTGAYAGTITLASGFTTFTLTMTATTASAFSQPTPGTDITVTGYTNSGTQQYVSGSFLWTRGTLNSSSHEATLHLVGAEATITPFNGFTFPPPPPGPATVITGSTLNLEAAGEVASVLTVNPGIVQFNNGTGVTLGENTSMFVNAQTPAGQQANVTFSGDGKPWIETDKQITLKTGATLTVTGPGVWNDSQHQILNAGGTVRIQGNATVNLTVPVPVDTASFLQTSGVLKLHTGSTLAVSGAGAVFTGGGINIVADSAQGETAPAKLQLATGGKLYVNGNTCVLAFTTPDAGWWPAGTQLYWTFQVTGDVVWYNGTYKPRVNAAANGIADVFEIDGMLTIPTGKTFTIAPVTYNLPPAGLPVDFQRTIVKALNGLTNNGTITVESLSPPYKATINAPIPGGTRRDINLIPG